MLAEQKSEEGRDLLCRRNHDYVSVRESVGITAQES